jgi:hypothetical protein
VAGLKVVDRLCATGVVSSSSGCRLDWSVRVGRGRAWIGFFVLDIASIRWVCFMKVCIGMEYSGGWMDDDEWIDTLI